MQRGTYQKKGNRRKLTWPDGPKQWMSCTTITIWHGYLQSWNIGFWKGSPLFSIPLLYSYPGLFVELQITSFISFIWVLRNDTINILHFNSQYPPPLQTVYLLSYTNFASFLAFLALRFLFEWPKENLPLSQSNQVLRTVQTRKWALVATPSSGSLWRHASALQGLGLQDLFQKGGWGAARIFSTFSACALGLRSSCWVVRYSSPNMVVGDVTLHCKPTARKRCSITSRLLKTSPPKQKTWKPPKVRFKPRVFRKPLGLNI